MFRFVALKTIRVCQASVYSSLHPRYPRISTMSSASSTYLKPHPSLEVLVSDPTPSFSFSSRAEYCIFYDVPTHLTLEDVTREEIRIAGLRFNGPLRSASRVRWSSWAKIRPMKRVLDTMAVDENKDIPIQVPPGTRMRMFEFSKTNTHLAFLVDGKTSTELWVADVKTGQSKRLATHLNAVMMRPFQWRKKNLLLSVIPEHRRGEPPKPPAIPAGPIVKEHEGGKAAPARTYHDLITSDVDELVFEHYTESQILLCDPDTGKVQPLINEPALYSSIEISQDCKHVLVHKTVRPYSRTLPAPRFSHEIFVERLPVSLEQWNTGQGKERLHFATIPCQEDLSTSFDARPRGPRNVEFAWNEPHTIVYVQALDDGEPTNPADKDGNRDAAYMVRSAPFNDASKHQKIFAAPLRIDSIWWTEEGKLLIEESWYKTRQENMHVLTLGKDGKPESSRLLYSRSSDDAYGSWGSPRVEFVVDSSHWRLKRRPSDGAIMFIGEGASPNGSRPFVDFVNIDTGKRERVWRGPPVPNPSIPEDPSLEPGNQAPQDSSRRAAFERAVDIIWKGTNPFTTSENWVIVISESPESPPNIYLRHLPYKDSSAAALAVTSFPNPQPSLIGVKKELIRYNRADGVELSATLYLPPGHDGTTRLPLLCWAYPLEFKSKEHASQIKTSPFRFMHTSWSRPTLWLARGWAILDDFSVPIVGVGQAEPNDTFIEQLVSSAEAAVQECVRRGVADPDRVAVGGHSYGAFMAVHLLAHTRLFKAAIGRSGAYNRLLTPFSYQAEERTFWQVPEMYVRNSPFTHADKIEDPLLLIHGADDPNPGTHAFQTERLYAAMQGLGKKVRMVILPHERHSYDAIESVLHVLAEQDNFLVKHVLQGKESASDESNRAKRAKI